MKIIRTRAEMRTLTRDWRAQGDTIAVVPTMGALHAGHLSLVEAARTRADRVVVTLFVNPKQFNNPDDLTKYPRTEESDAAKLAPLEVDILYAPGVEEMYPDGFATTVSVQGISDNLCGAARPGHFDGVATIVTKLLLQTDADIACFGEKDFQQLQVVRRMARDLDIKTEILGCPTVREEDGLALSSRNVRLGKAARHIAPVLPQVLHEAADRLRQGDPVRSVLDDAERRLAEAGIGPVDYLEFRKDHDLSLIEDSAASGRLFVAAWLDGVRLIDNIAVRP